MRARSIGVAVMLAAGALAGCAGKAQQLQLRDGTGDAKDVVFPKGRLFGGVSQEQVGALAQMLATTSNATSERLDKVDQTTGTTADAAGRIETKTQAIEARAQQIETATRDIQASEKRIESSTTQIAEGTRRIEGETQQIAETTQRIDGATQRISDATTRVAETTRRIDETGAKTYDTTKMILEAFEKVSKKQGTGELTIFFPVASSRIEPGSLQHQRVVTFVDFLARESRGRKLMLVSVGSASAFGPAEVNQRLAKERSEAPLDIVDQYLVNLPHEYVKIYGTGDVYSPRDVTMKEHQRFQATRLIAFYEMGQQPQLPEAPAPGPGAVSQR
jgi:hypothetical protein